MRRNFAEGGLKEWFKQDWVDIGAKKKGGGFKKCGRKSAVSRKRAVAQGVGGKPTNVKTFAKRTKAMGGGFMAKRMAMR